MRKCISPNPKKRFDSVLRLRLPTGCVAVTYADDLDLEAGDECLELIDGWLKENRLKLAPHKTEASILKGKRMRDQVSFRLEECMIRPKRAVKYLGVWLDDKLCYTEHVRRTIEKAEKSVRTINRILLNVGGPRYEKSLLASLQKKMLLRVAAAYRTVSNEALQVITGILSIDLHLQDCKQTAEGAYRRDVRRETMVRWQDRWENKGRVASWTRQLIRSVNRWVQCEWKGTLDYFVIQFLTGHGSYRAYT